MAAASWLWYGGTVERALGKRDKWYWDTVGWGDKVSTFETATRPWTERPLDSKSWQY
jgi:hypothetical protein